MNRIRKQVIYVLSFLLSFYSFAYAGVEGHWAEDEINLLISRGILSGQGDIRPDDRIIRAEFVRIVNRTFDFKVQAKDSFTDLQKSEWYNAEFLIAKEAGYIKGDEQGRANPTASLTRAEASAILFRVLNLRETNQKLNFQDQEQIPDWATKEINSLAAKGYLKGYPDLTFRPQNDILRAEAIYIIANIIKEKDAEEQKRDQTNSPAVVVRPSSGGGGNNNSGSGRTEKPSVAVPVISRYVEDGDKIEWIGVANAAGFEVKVTAENQKETFYVSADNKSQYSISLNSVFNIISGKFDDSQITFSVTLKAIGKSGYEDSKESKTLTVEKIYMPLDSPALSLRSGLENQIPRAIVSWNAVLGASGYEISVKVDGNQIDPSQYSYSVAKREILIKNLSLIEDKKCEVFVKAISEDRTVKKNSLVSSIQISNESQQNGSPQQIYTAQDFEKIRTTPDKDYLLMRNIDLGEFVPITEFTGTLTTYNHVPLAVKADIKQSGINDVGIFRTISGNAIISNLLIEGSVNGGSQVGAIAGNMTGKSRIVNCINLASVKGVTSVGGLVGKSNSVNGTSVVENSKNAGIVNGTGNNVGGIIGYGTGTNITGCANLAGVTASTRNAGGIAGAFYSGNIENSYNTATVTVSSNCGGIAGNLGGSTAILISKCYNQGEVKGTSVSGGILGLVPTSLSATVSYCYNTGSMNDAGYPISTRPDLVTVSNCLYSNRNFDDNVKDTEYISSENLKNPNAPQLAGFLQNDFEFESNHEFPSIKNNPYLQVSDILRYEYVSDLMVTYSEELQSLNYSWNNPAMDTVEKIKIILKNNSTISELVNVELTNGEESFVYDGVTKGDYYEISVILVYEDGTELVMNLETLAE